MEGVSTATINIDMDKACTQCGENGACDNGLCLKCVAKRITGRRPPYMTDKKDRTKEYLKCVLT